MSAGGETDTSEERFVPPMCQPVRGRVSATMNKMELLAFICLPEQKNEIGKPVCQTKKHINQQGNNESKINERCVVCGDTAERMQQHGGVCKKGKSGTDQSKNRKYNENNSFDKS